MVNMLKIENFNVGSVIIEVTDVKRIEAKKSFGTEIPDSWFREMSFVDESGRCITLRLYAKTKKDLEIKEVEY